MKVLLLLGMAGCLTSFANPVLHLPTPVLLKHLPESIELGTDRLEFQVPTGKGALLIRTPRTKMRFRIPPEKLTLRIREQNPHRLLLDLRGSLADLQCESSVIKIMAPRGILGQAVTLTMESAKILLPGPGSTVQFQALLEVTPDPEGIGLQAKSAGIAFPSTPGTEPLLQLGAILVDGHPLKPDRIRELMIAATPGVFRARQAAIERFLGKILLENLKDQLGSVRKSFQWDLTSLLPGLGLQVLAGHFLPIPAGTGAPEALRASLRVIPRMNGHALAVTSEADAPIQVEVPSPREAGILIPESSLQHLIRVPEIQDRLQISVNDPKSSSGVSVLPAGIQLRLLHELQALSSILPLEIDLIRTVNAGSHLGERLRITLGDWIESWFGSGKSVRVPVEILMFPRINEETLTLTTRIPFTAAGEYLPPEHCAPELCPSNVDQMSRRVRRELMRTLHSRFSEQVPEVIQLPVGIVKTLKITPENALWLGTGGT